MPRNNRQPIFVKVPPANLEHLFNLFVAHAHPENLGRDSTDNGIRRDILDDNSSSRNNCPVPDLNSITDKDIRPYENVVTNGDALHFLKLIFRNKRQSVLPRRRIKHGRSGNSRRRMQPLSAEKIGPDRAELPNRRMIDQRISRNIRIVADRRIINAIRTIKLYELPLLGTCKDTPHFKEVKTGGWQYPLHETDKQITHTLTPFPMSQSTRRNLH